MKRLFAILLLVIYTSGLGAMINYHYCHGHLAKVQVLNLNKDKSCGCNDAGMRAECCKDEFVYYKFDSHNLLQPYSLAKQFTVAVEYTFIAYDKELQTEHGHRFYFYFLKGPLSGSGDKPLFLFNNVFRI